MESGQTANMTQFTFGVQNSRRTLERPIAKGRITLSFGCVLMCRINYRHGFMSLCLKRLPLNAVPHVYAPPLCAGQSKPMAHGDGGDDRAPNFLEHVIDGNRKGVHAAIKKAGSPAARTALVTTASPAATSLRDRDLLLAQKTPVWLAAYHGHSEILSELLAEIPNVVAATAPNENTLMKGGMNPLHAAVQSDDVDTVNEMLRIHPAVDAVATTGDTPLLYVVRGMHNDANARTNRERVRIMHALLQAHANVNARNIDGQTPLIVAAESYSDREGEQGGETSTLAITALLEGGASVNDRANDGTTALHYALRNPEDARLVRLLNERNASFDRVGNADLAKAIELSPEDVVETLLHECHNITADAPDLLYLAVKRGSLRIVQWLLDRGATPDQATMDEGMIATPRIHRLLQEANSRETGKRSRSTWWDPTTWLFDS